MNTSGAEGAGRRHENDPLASGLEVQFGVIVIVACCCDLFLVEVLYFRGLDLFHDPRLESFLCGTT